MKISKSKINRFARLKSKKFRNELGLFTVEGTKGVCDTIGFFRLENLVATENWLEENSSIIRDIEPEKILSASERELKQISSLSTPPQVIAVYRIPHDDFDINKELPADFYIVLDGVQDPGNLGTIIRTAHWFGINRIFCSADTVDVFNPKTIQSTMGSLSKVKVTYCDILHLISKNPGLDSYALDLKGSDLFDQNSFNPGFFIFGREGSGLRPDVKEKVSEFLTIPPSDKANHPDSLNVAVAAAVTVAQIKK